MKEKTEIEIVRKKTPETGTPVIFCTITGLYREGYFDGEDFICGVTHFMFSREHVDFYFYCNPYERATKE